jgi:hypothetical protein
MEERSRGFTQSSRLDPKYKKENTMTIHIETHNGVCHVNVAGEMTIYHAAEIKAELLPASNWVQNLKSICPRS